MPDERRTLTDDEILTTSSREEKPRWATTDTDDDDMDTDADDSDADVDADDPS
jgi:hypothetical protein